MFGVIGGCVALMWKLSAEREYRTRMPDADRFFPSRHWSKQIIEFERGTKDSK
ncbi:uncharacterized protein H6S33_008957 [Morchella sextelata]|uniref:uncharacterized protein n=1 Tax=Morchella sextelata TaxID=1174677 RepID=UPI001D04BE20|nr:uncharacterized protein H6S33_008957 [Morchella sextelata]KAH0612577.1 hypothetical protein H6S33_008957 [Morchella sextelata]